MLATTSKTTKPKGRVAGRRKRNRTMQGGKQGKPSWVTGTKLAFFERYKEPWISAGDKPGHFYSDITKRFLIKYGWDRQYSERGADLEEDTDDPDEDAVAAFLSPEDEVEERAEYYFMLRTKIAQWYRYHYKKILAEDSLETSVDALLSGLGGPRKPRKRRTLHEYSEKYYESRVKPLFDAEMEKQMAAWEGGELEKKPEAVNVRNKVLGKQWAAETAAFRARVEAEVVQAHEDAMEEYDAALEAARGAADSRTPGEFHKLLSTAAATLDPLAESLAARYGMAVSILLAGPIPDKGGAIEVLSTHAGKTRSRAPKTWPQADATGFTAVVTSMTRFATLAFSQDQCDARALPNVPLASRPRLGLFGMQWSDGSEDGEDEEEEGEDPNNREGDEDDDEVPLSALSAVARKRKEKVAKEKAKTKRAKERENRRKEKEKENAADGAEAPTRPKPRPIRRNAGTAAGPAPDPSSSTGPTPRALGASANPDGVPSTPPAPPRDNPSDGAPSSPPAPPRDNPTTPPAPPRVNPSDGAPSSPPAPPRDNPSDSAPSSPPAPPRDTPGDSVRDTPSAPSTPPAPPRDAPSAGASTAATGTADPPPREMTPAAKEVSVPPPWKRVGATWGERWEDCAFAYLAFEEASGFPFERVRIPKGPREGLGIDAWISTGRKLNYDPCLLDLEELRTKFWRWWRGLQPEERRVEEGVLSRKGGIDWAGLRDYSGKNGLLQATMVLGWWGNKVHRKTGGSAEEVAQWELAVDDVAWALEEMVKEGKLSKKRALERGVEDKPAPVKKARLA
ncbi:hypothetical protein B0H11DRAFT_2218460 [Mycena galericulata]|nr:hypothetical protein B0H11DRAFT_2218460 [Mycena galericulata]